jgi:hypothetical protein
VDIQSDQPLPAIKITTKMKSLQYNILYEWGGNHRLLTNKYLVNLVPRMTGWWFFIEIATEPIVYKM